MYLEKVLQGLNLGYVFKLIGRTVLFNIQCCLPQQGVKDTLSKEELPLTTIKRT